MTDILHEFYCLVDESLRAGNSDGPAERTFYASLSEAQRSLFEDFLSESGDFDDAERQRLFFFALHLGITLAAGDTRRF
ncbi:MAG: hypothetical protein EOM52_05715 [Clostridia bacterium]|nr:hypothetical protein [Clostridia bacterium]